VQSFFCKAFVKAEYNVRKRNVCLNTIEYVCRDAIENHKKFKNLKHHSDNKAHEALYLHTVVFLTCLTPLQITHKFNQFADDARCNICNEDEEFNVGHRSVNINISKCERECLYIEFFLGYAWLKVQFMMLFD
jgi:hypothetical protein